MKKSVLFAIIVGIIVGIIGGGIYVWKKKTVTVPTNVMQEQPKVKLLDWKDPNGFSLQYPEGIIVNKHDEDKENYAHIEMTHPSNPGNIIVWGKDTSASDISVWLKSEKLFREAAIVDTTLGGQPAKKILISTPTKKLIIGTIFDEILWYIEADTSQGEFWQQTLDSISSSFKFTPLPGESSAGEDSVEEEVMVDEEEVIE